MRIRLLLNILLRFIVLVSLCALIAKPVSREYYDNYYSTALLKIHTTDLDFFSDQLRTKLSYYLLMNDLVALQQVLDSNFGLFGFVITDCTSSNKICPEQRIIHSSNPNLEWRTFPTVDDLAGSHYILLHGASPVSVTSAATAAAEPGAIIGRLYMVTNIPLSFDEDYRLWLSTPFKEVGPWPYYLRTMEFCLLGGVLLWLVVELLLRMRRIQMRSARQREYELMSNADNYLTLLEEKNSQLEEQEQRTNRQFETYLNRIRELEQKVTNSQQYRELAESVIQEMEEEKTAQLARLTDELNQTRFEMDTLRDKIAALDSVSRKAAPPAAVEEGKPAFTNRFEQKLFETLFRTPKYTRGDWRIINSFNVAAGKSHSQFTDCILISKDCLIVLEAKNYTGKIDAEGDFENDRWYAVKGTEKMEVQSLWGDNPFHQVNEYCMSLLRMVQKRSSWNIPVYGVIVFPEGADLSVIGNQIGRFYRIATIDRLVAVLDIMEAEARRHNSFTKRPTPHQIENIIRGRAAGAA